MVSDKRQSPAKNHNILKGRAMDADPHDHHASEKSGIHSFKALNGVMFQGAFSDNIYKLVLTFMVIDVAMSITGDAEAGEKLGATYQSLIGVAFALPWILAAGFSGWLSTRFSMTRVTQWTKIMEICTMTLAIVAFSFSGVSAVYFGVAVMFLMALQSALFSPSKYGILPRLVGVVRVGWANGVLQGFTFLSIVLGTIAAPLLYGVAKEDLGGNIWVVGIFLVALAVLGYAISLSIRHETPSDAQRKLTLMELSQVLTRSRDIYRHPGLFWAALGTFAWWLVAVLIQSAAPLMLKSTLAIPDKWASLGLLPMALFMGIGSFVAARFSRDHVELGLIPVGSLGMLVASMVIALVAPNAGEFQALENNQRLLMQIVIPALMGLVALFAGFVIVPLQSYILKESPETKRAGIWATVSFYTAISWVVAAVLYGLLVNIFGGAAEVFLLSGVIMAFVALLITWRFPRIPLRVMVVLFVYTFYHVKAKHVDRVPKTGGALLAPNHQAYIDAILIASVLDRPIRFVVSKKMYRQWWVYPFARATNSIPIEADQSPRDLIKALKTAREAIDDGHLVCLFPEGALTRNGQVQPFRRGIERVMKDSEAPILPVGIDGAYDSALSLKEGRFAFWKRLRLFPKKRLHVVIGQPEPASTDLWVLREKVQALLSEAFVMRKETTPPLHRAAIHSLRKRLLKKDFSDHSTETCVPNLKFLMGLSILGHRLKPHWEKEEFVGLLLPPTIGASICNVAITTAGRTPVNLNYTASKDILKDICERTGINVVITSRQFVEKAGLDTSIYPKVIYLEDIREEITTNEKVEALLKGVLLPVSVLERSLGRKMKPSVDDLATLIFSSGSTGAPKGVKLTHWNISANIWGTLQVVALPDKDPRFLGILPFFHSFGYTATFWLPLIRGIGASYYPNPLDARAVGDIVEKQRVTHMFATPTFLSGYQKRIDPGKLGSLTFLVTGAEKLRLQTADAFERKFGIRPREGFGCTECSPIVALNGSDFRTAGVYQPGGKSGTVGRPVPSVIVEIRSVNDGKVKGPNEEGMLYVKGPNVMQGYFAMEEKTKEVLSEDGWYKTGDIAMLDDEGFLSITGRLSRFSKLGGEMVPHGRVEDELHEFIDCEGRAFAVTGVPDEKKGERLVAFYTAPEEDAKKAVKELADSGRLPSLWIPRWNDFRPIDELPMLGSGKIDLQQLNALAKKEFSEP